MSYSLSMMPSLPPDNPALRRFLRDVWAKEQHPSWVRYVDTQSMAPSLHGPVDLCVQWGMSQPLQPGDLFVFEDPVLHILVAHRVCQVDESGGRVLQAGDRLLARGIPGNWIGSDAVFGRVIALRWPGTPRGIGLNRPGVVWIGRQIARSSARLWTDHQGGPIPARMLHRAWCWAYRLALLISQEVAHESNAPLPQN